MSVQMPHESTVTEQEDIKFKADEERLVQSRTRSRSHPHSADVHPAGQGGSAGRPRVRALSLVAETPTRITHHHDDDDDDESSLGVKNTA